MLPQNIREIPPEFPIKRKDLSQNKDISHTAKSEPEIHAQGEPCLLKNSNEHNSKPQRECQASQSNIMPALAALIMLDILK